MARSRLSLICLSIAAAIMLVPLAIVRGVERVATAVWAWLSPAFAYEPAFALDLGDRQVAFAGDCPVDAAMSHSLRHEAGMRRLN
jgi:hypothetical protein